MAKAGYNVTLIVADGLGDEEKDGVYIADIGKPSSRLTRVLFFRKKILKRALSIPAGLYHFHDPELLGVGRKLIAKNQKVIYDSHEDVPRQLLTKAYIPAIFRKIISRLFEWFENNAAAKFSGIVTATPFIKERYLKVNSNVIEVQNFPILEEFKDKGDENILIKEDVVCYVGAISKVRGILPMTDAMAHTGGIKLLLGGKFENQDLRNLAVQSPGWKNVNELGFLNRSQVQEVLNKSVAGLVVLEPTINYLDSIPVKMFEYMAAGIPVIASDFDYWKQLLDGVDCALFVNPLDPSSIARAITALVEDKSRARSMGAQGRKSVYARFNWKKEEEKLLNIYSKILS